MAKNALIVWGGWDGHEPKQVGERFADFLRADGFDVELSNSLDRFLDEATLIKLSLIVPIWTMGKITDAQAAPVFKAVRSGVGLAGCHGGMCDAFRENTEWHFMTGGQWVAHPGNDGVKYTVNIANRQSPIMQGIDDFEVSSEQYYMHVDPAVKVLATTRFPIADGPHASNGPVDMPVVWTKRYGEGNIFFNSLGHHADVLDSEPCKTIMRRGCAWAARD